MFTPEKASFSTVLENVFQYFLILVFKFLSLWKQNKEKGMEKITFPTPVFVIGVRFCSQRFGGLTERCIAKTDLIAQKSAA